MQTSLSHAGRAAKPSRMGRPALGFEATKIRLPKALKDRVAALVGERGLAEFVRQAVEVEVSRREAEGGQSPDVSDADR